MHILLAPNAFKNSLDATRVAKALGAGLQKSKLDCTFDYFPIGDGGDGTAPLIIKKHNGTIIRADAHDAVGRKIKSQFGLIENSKTAVIELAGASGIRLLSSNELNPLRASTYGTGELIKRALDKGVNKIILCIGGSATVDGGSGILHCLGIQFLNKRKELLSGLPQSLAYLDSIDLSGFDKRILDCELILLCDVENKLLGKDGAAKIFGPQKGATPEQVRKLERSLIKLKQVTFQTTGFDMEHIQHGGAAGGVAAGLAAFCKAKLVNGIDYFLDLNGFNEALQKANVIITGEGIIDAQTLEGKGPYGVALRAKDKNIPVIGVAGKLPLARDSILNKYFNRLISINEKPVDIKVAIKNTRKNLVKTGKAIGDMMAVEGP